MIEGIRENGSESAEFVIRKVRKIQFRRCYERENFLHRHKSCSRLSSICCFAIFQVLEKRHSQELKDLERMFQEERKVAVDEALAKMEERHSQESDELRAQNEKELRDLEKQSLSPDDLQQRRAQLLNQQQLRQSALDKKHAEERKQIQHGVLSDWEIRFARAKLELKEKHYQVGIILDEDFLVDPEPFKGIGGYCT